MCPLFAVMCIMKNTASPFSFYTAQTKQTNKAYQLFHLLSYTSSSASLSLIHPTLYMYALHWCYHLIKVTKNMHFHKCSFVGGLKKVMFFVLLITFLVCGENQESSSVVEPQKKHSQMQHQHQTTAQPFDVYMSQMRRVPNTSDPLHNR